MDERYSDIVLAARRALLGTLPDALRRALADLLVAELDEVAQKYARRQITEATARAFVADVRRALVRYTALAEPEVKRAVLTAARRAVDSHAEALAVVGADVPGTFAGLPVRAYEAAYVRRSLGLVDSFKTLSRRHATQNAAAIGRAIERAVGQGQTYEEATRAIMRALATDDTLAGLVEDYGSRGGLRRAARARGVVPDPTAAALVRKLGSDARRIALTEINSAYHEGDIAAANESGVVAGLAWNLSPLHPKNDVCDGLALTDAYGLGAGVYPPEAVPPVPHPYCLCFRTHVLRPEGEWGRPRPRPAAPRAIAQPRLSLSDAAWKRERDKLRALVTSAYHDDTYRTAA